MVVSTVYDSRIRCETLERLNSDIPGHNSFDAVSPRSAQAVTMQMPALRPAAVSVAAQPVKEAKCAVILGFYSC